ncbi:MAG: tetratricopeptide repeat protein [Acidobacteriota bacterium]
MRKWTGLICAALLLGLLPSTPAEGAGSRPTTPPPPAAPEQPKTPEQEGKAAYNLGLKHRDKAWKLEDKAKAAASDSDRDKHLEKAMKQYEKSIPLFETATGKIPSFHQAFSSLGYALRKTGQHEKALEAYDTALKLAPFYGEAVEYRAEAYLGLNRIEEAKDAYMQLFSSNRELANQLMEAMQAWLEARQADPAGVSAETIEGFATWVKERSELANASAQLYSTAGRAW